MGVWRSPFGVQRSAFSVQRSAFSGAVRTSVTLMGQGIGNTVTLLVHVLILSSAKLISGNELARTVPVDQEVRAGVAQTRSPVGLFRTFEVSGCGSERWTSYRWGRSCM